MFLALETAIYLALLLLSASLVPKIQSKFIEKLSLGSAMILALVGILGISSAMLWLLARVILSGANGSLILSWALLGTCILAIIQYLAGPYIVEAIYGLREAPEDLQELVNSIAESLGMKSGLKVYIYSGEPNAFAFGNFLSGRRIAISTELLRILEPDELRAVIGHELGHHLHRDNALMFAVSLLPSFVYNLSYWLLVRALYFNDDRDSSGYELIVGLLGIAASIIVQLLVLAFSRLREYYADRVGARIAGVISMQAALARLHAYYESDLQALQRVRASSLRQMFIYALVDSLVDFTIDEKLVLIERAKHAKYSVLQELLSTHPPISKRLRALESLQA